MKKTISILALCVILLSLIGAPIAHAEGRSIECESSNMYPMKAEIIKIKIDANVVIPEVRFPILFYSETPLGQIYGIYATDCERVDKCIWGMIGEHIYYALISPQFIEEMKNGDNLHLILFSQP